MPTRPPSKRAALLRLLSEGMVLVQLDARRDGVQVPSRHADDAQLRLNLSHRFANRDLTLDADAVSCTLSFAGAPFHCRLPYRSIYAATSHVTGEAVVWREDLPEDGLPAPLAEVPLPRATALKGVPSGGGERADPGAAPTPAPARARSHLRLIK